MFLFFSPELPPLAKGHRMPCLFPKEILLRPGNAVVLARSHCGSGTEEGAYSTQLMVVFLEQV
ncbi:hypothetical protein V1478_000493 [Vespula squamosa]|uniref:Uncharacterized protein n=1 Tax=Vespula squamosa TaxID=30214 RepID=A0ABD2C5M8_VESSQ